MKVQIRQGVFETNSSSSHAVCIMTDEEYLNFLKDEIVVDRYGNFISKEEYLRRVDVEKKERINRETRYYIDRVDAETKKKLSIHDYLADVDEEPTNTEYDFDKESMDLVHEERNINGTTVHAISIYGYDE